MSKVLFVCLRVYRSSIPTLQLHLFFFSVYITFFYLSLDPNRTLFFLSISISNSPALICLNFSKFSGIQFNLFCCCRSTKPFLKAFNVCPFLWTLFSAIFLLKFVSFIYEVFWVSVSCSKFCVKWHIFSVFLQNIILYYIFLVLFYGILNFCFYVANYLLITLKFLVFGFYFLIMLFLCVIELGSDDFLWPKIRIHHFFLLLESWFLLFVTIILSAVWYS